MAALLLLILVDPLTLVETTSKLVVLGSQEISVGLAAFELREKVFELTLTIVFWEVSKLVCESLLGDTLKGVLISFLTCCWTCCSKRKVKEEPERDALYVSEGFRRGSVIHLYEDCDSFKRSKTTAHGHFVCILCQKEKKKAAHEE